MNKICLIVLLSLFGLILADNNDLNRDPAKNPNPSSYDVVVESSLSIKPKPSPKRNRRGADAAIETIYLYAPQGRLYRNKRQFNFGNNRFPNQNFQNPNFPSQNFPSFQSSAAAAQAQAFNTHGPLGGFGASAANANSQNINFGPNGLTGGASLGGSQTYNLPNGQNINVAYSNGLTLGANPSSANSHSITYS